MGESQYNETDRQVADEAFRQQLEADEAFAQHCYEMGLGLW